MYDPSITATKEPSEIDSQSHDTPPVTCRCSHSQVFPQEWKTSMNDLGAGRELAHVAKDVQRQLPSPRVSSTEQIALWRLRG